MYLQCNRFLAFLIVLSVGVLTACGPESNTRWEENRDDRVQVATSFSILEDLARQVGGEHVVVRSLVPRESDPHTFDANPRDGRTLSGADLVVEIGAGFEPWIDRLHASSRSRAHRLALTGVVDLMTVACERPRHFGHGQCGTGEKDPHVWLDVRKTMKMVEALRAALVEVDPDGAAYFEANASRYLADLEELDTWIESRVAAIPAPRRRLFTHHDVFRYFASRYEFDVVGTALTAATTDVFDPAASDVGHQIETLRAAGVPAVFPEKGSNARLLTRIAAEASVRVGPSLYTDYLSHKGGEASTYIDMMRYNVETLVTHLGDDGSNL